MCPVRSVTYVPGRSLLPVQNNFLRAKANECRAESNAGARLVWRRRRRFGSFAGREQVGEDEAVAREDYTGRDVDGALKHGAGAGERVELAVFAARIDVVRKIGEEARVEAAAGEGRADFGRVDASDEGAEAGAEHFAGERARVAAPNGKDGRHTDGGKLAFAIGADVFQEEITEDDVRDALRAREGHGVAHGLLVGFVGAWRRDRHFDEREAGGVGLKL